MWDDLGRMLVFLGGTLLLVGLLLILAGRLPGLGRLPGDIVIERDNWTLYMPLGTMILLSVLLTVLFNLVARLWR